VAGRVPGELRANIGQLEWVVSHTAVPQDFFPGQCDSRLSSNGPYRNTPVRRTYSAGNSSPSKATTGGAHGVAYSPDGRRPIPGNCKVIITRRCALSGRGPVEIGFGFQRPWLVW
jgi:hypothetical protein